MDDTDARARADVGPETTWALDAPEWHTYMMGWRAGYEACQRDGADRVTPAVADALVVERLGALLKDLRVREDGIF